MKMPFKRHAKIFALTCLAIWFVSMAVVFATGSATYKSCADPQAHCALRGYGFGGKVLWVVAVLGDVAFLALIYGLILMLLTRKSKQADK